MQSPTFLFGRKEKDSKNTEESKLNKKDKEDEKNKKDKKDKRDKKGSKDEEKDKAKEDKEKLKEEKERSKREKKEQELLAKESKSKKDKDNKDKKDKDKKDKKGKSDKEKDSKKDKKSKKSEDGKKDTSGQDSSLISDKDRSLTQESSFDTSSVPSSPERVDVSQLSAEGSPLPGYTKPYNYLDESSDPKNKGKVLVGAFSYENKDKVESPKDEHETSSGRHVVGIAFNYAPGEAQKVAETAAEKRKTLLEKSGNESDVPVGLRTPGLDYVESAVRKEQAKTGADLSPGARRALDMKGGGIFHSGKDNKPSGEDTNKGWKTAGEGKVTKDKLGSSQIDPKMAATIAKDNKGTSSAQGNLNQYDEGLKGGTYPYGAAGDSPHLLQDINKEFLRAERGYLDQPYNKVGSPATVGGPKIVKTTTKQSVVKDREGVTQNIEEKVEDMQSGEVTVSTQVNKVCKLHQMDLFSITTFLYLLVTLIN